jgi:hypothetical protein
VLPASDAAITIPQAMIGFRMVPSPLWLPASLCD